MDSLGNKVITPTEVGIVTDVLLHIMKLLGKNYPKLSEGVRDVIMGKNFVTRTEEIFEDGVEKGRAEGRVEGRAEGRVEGRAEGRVEGADEAIIGTIQLFLEDGKSKDEIFARLAKKFHLEQEKFEDLFHKATENED